MVAGRTPGRPGKNHVFHAGPAHILEGIFPHHPAHSLQQVGFATAIRAHHAGQAWFDEKVGCVHEGLETGKTKTRKLHVNIRRIRGSGDPVEKQDRPAGLVHGEWVTADASE